MNRPLAALLAVVVLTACGGGGGSSVPSAPKPASTGVGVLAFSIVVPVKPAPSSARRKPAYVSPATQSVSFQVGASTPQIVTLALGSATCPLMTLGYTCTADAQVAAGPSQSLTIKTFASTDGSGAVLSQNTIVISVVAGQTNPVTVSLNGVAASLALAVLAPASVTKCTPSSVTATWSAMDAAGDTIVGPGTIVASDGTPVSPTLTVSDPVRFTVGAPNGNSWNVAYNGAGGVSPVTLTASNPLVTSGSAPVAVNAGSLLFTTAAAAVHVVPPPYTGAPTAIANGINGPVQVLVNSSCTLFVANSAGGGPGSVTLYAPPYTGAPIATVPGANVLDVALSSSGNLFVLNGPPTNTVTEFGAPYTGSPLATVDLSPVGSNFGNPLNISADSANDFFIVSDLNSATLVRAYSPPYAAATFVPANTPEQTVEQAVTNNLFVTSNGSLQLEYAPPYTGSPSATINPGTNVGGGGLALDPAGDFFVAYYGSSKIAEYQPPYTGGPAVTISVGLDGPATLALDPATGNLFASNLPPPSNLVLPKTVTVYAPPYTSAPFATVNIPGSNGALAVSP